MELDFLETPPGNKGLKILQNDLMYLWFPDGVHNLDKKVCFPRGGFNTCGCVQCLQVWIFQFLEAGWHLADSDGGLQGLLATALVFWCPSH